MSLDESYATRNALVHALREDLQGPRESHERLTDTPFETYVSGVLYPADAKRSAAEEHPDDDFDGEVAPIEQAVWDPTVNLANSHYPSSMGMTFAAKSDDSIPVVITVSAARYEFDSKDEVDTWVRKPIEIAPHELSLKTPGTSVTELEAGLELYTNVREADTDGVASVTVAVINRRNAPPRERDADCYFQVALEATADGRPAFLDRTYKDDEISDPDLESYRLLYRDHRQYATGHGTAVEWEESDANEGAIRLTTTPIPAHELLLADSNPDIPSSGLGMLHLAECQQQELVNSLESLANSYSEWITNESERIDSLPDSLRGTASAHLTECSDACERMRAGIRGLSSNPSAMRAFRLANRAMLGQRARARWVAEGQPDGGPAEDESHVWRPFQIAFILVNLSSIIDPKSEDREVLDLLWFPTGGGKTEAYLGLIAFTILLRRLRGGSAGGAGVTVIMRYTLRLLTIQQFDRAAGLICALEQIRRNEDDLGTDEISLGLWVGRDGTPKNVADAGNALDRLRQGLPVNTGNPMQLRACPWCGTILSPREYWIGNQPPRLVTRCANDECDFHEKLPVHVVDEDIYRVKPSLVIATADKFATLPWVERAHNLFGEDAGLEPPELIVQDELHLISGPLGTLAGLYEAVIDTLCTTKSGTRPKVIASTATIRRAGPQVESLFDRRMKQFPPPAIDASDSFFAKEAPRTEKASRLYVGAFAPGTSQSSLRIRSYAALMQAVNDLDVPDSLKDPYWTLVGYFNSRRVLGGARIQVNDDVKARLGVISPSPESTRKVERMIELTGRATASEIPGHLENLAKGLPNEETLDCVLATNMISVGVDVDRLGLMVVSGQPQTTAEYIQATSRVGRKHPGLVLTVYNSARSRDRSHFENFTAYHSSLYRQVESTSVTPFSPRARDRALSALLFSLVRVRIPEMRSNAGAAGIEAHLEEVRAFVSVIATRAERIEPGVGTHVTAELEKVIAQWRLMNSESSNLVYANPRDRHAATLLEPADRTDGNGFPTPTSLRDVDSESNLYRRGGGPIGAVRRSQLVTTYGIGAIIPVGDETFMVAGAGQWPPRDGENDLEPDLGEPRLEKSLGVYGFVTPPAGNEDRGDVPVVRFPSWQSCSHKECMRLARHGDLAPQPASNDCGICGVGQLIPSRFVMVCDDGHLDDFPYDRWVHKGRSNCGRTSLQITSSAQTASLAGIIIECTECKANRTMEHAFDMNRLRQVTRCTGQHHWDANTSAADCSSAPRVLQRGAAAVWFGSTRSALSIPPWSQAASRLLDSHWKTLRVVPDAALRPTIEALHLPEKTGTNLDDLVDLARKRRAAESDEIELAINMRKEEYDALIKGRPETTQDIDFATRPSKPDISVAKWVSQVQLVTRLREVRALVGFSRVQAADESASQESNIVSVRDPSVSWLPAIEVKGEGIFVRLDSNQLADWSSSEGVKRRVDAIREADKARLARWDRTPENEITAEFLLLHTLGHALINQLALDAGYPAASLRERVYADDDSRGLLVYTATTDSAGSLGGLLAQGEPDRFAVLLRSAIHAMSWCSADPVCMESKGSGMDSLNLAACHCCLLLPETSCEHMNGYLDRAMLVGTPKDAKVGFFSGLSH